MMVVSRGRGERTEGPWKEVFTVFFNSVCFLSLAEARKESLRYSPYTSARRKSFEIVRKRFCNASWFVQGSVFFVTQEVSVAR